MFLWMLLGGIASSGPELDLDGAPLPVLALAMPGSGVRRRGSNASTRVQVCALDARRGAAHARPSRATRRPRHLHARARAAAARAGRVARGHGRRRRGRGLRAGAGVPRQGPEAERHGPPLPRPPLRGARRARGALRGRALLGGLLWCGTGPVARLRHRQGEAAVARGAARFWRKDARRGRTLVDARRASRRAEEAAYGGRARAEPTPQVPRAPAGAADARRARPARHARVPQGRSLLRKATGAAPRARASRGPPPGPGRTGETLRPPARRGLGALLPRPGASGARRRAPRGAGGRV
mmetsp:Transcript_20917/g.62407  ORF Transcript_20917/g.62407 Transcript_20917/m.62407 type:complete len:297 (+) Transcript_20917:387-1277(+)